MQTNTDDAKQDTFLRWAANDIMTKQGLDEDHAWTIVLNTYCN
jgi:hypothetical protein